MYERIFEIVRTKPKKPKEPEESEEPRKIQCLHCKEIFDVSETGTEFDEFRRKHLEAKHSEIKFDKVVSFDSVHFDEVMTKEERRKREQKKKERDRKNKRKQMKPKPPKIQCLLCQKSFPMPKKKRRLFKMQKKHLKERHMEEYIKIKPKLSLNERMQLNDDNWKEMENEGVFGNNRRYYQDGKLRYKRRKKQALGLDDYEINEELFKARRPKVKRVYVLRLRKWKLQRRYKRWMMRKQTKKLKKDIHSKLTQVQMKQDKLNDALQSVQDFMDKSPNFTNAKNRAKAKDLQQHLLRAAESQVAYLRGLLEKVRIIREFEQEQDMRRNKNNRGMLMKLLYFQAQTLPLWVSTVKEPFAGVGVGACAVDELKPIGIGELCAAYFDETWILARVVHVHPSGKYDLKDVDCKQKPKSKQLRKRKVKNNHPKFSRLPHILYTRWENKQRMRSMWSRKALSDKRQKIKLKMKKWMMKKKEPRIKTRDYMMKVLRKNDWSTPLPRGRYYRFCVSGDEDKELKEGKTFSVFRKRLIALPRYRADPARDSHALFPPEAIVLALYPQTTCFYKGVIIKPPPTATEDYLISFEDKVYPSGWSYPCRVPQRYVVTYKEIKSHKKKMNIFEEIEAV